MTEDEWLACDNPPAMLRWLAEEVVSRKGRQAGPQRDRKFRLYACACLRLAWRKLPKRSREAVEYVEAYADAGDLTDWYRQSRRVRSRAEPGVEGYNLFWEGFNLPASVCGVSKTTLRYGADAPTQRALVRCVFGNPFRPVPLDPASRTATVVSLAEAAYQERQLPEGKLEQQRLAVLADALEDAGCYDEELLGHLRSEGPHVRGCWVVDHLLSRE
jgi:hypothetical protein